MRTREQVSFSPLPRRSAQTKIYAGQETAKPNKKGRCHFGLRFTARKEDHCWHHKQCEEPNEGHTATVASSKKHAGER